VVGVETSIALLGRLLVGTGKLLVMTETQFHGCEVAEKTPLYICCQISHVLVAPPTPRPGTPTAYLCQHNLGCPKPCTRSRGQYDFRVIANPASGWLNQEQPSIKASPT
jgi:hypothetical protein